MHCEGLGSIRDHAIPDRPACSWGPFVPVPRQGTASRVDRAGTALSDRPGVSLGDTLFESAEAAYEDLPTEVKRRVDRLRAVNSYNAMYDRKASEFGVRPGLTKGGQVAHPWPPFLRGRQRSRAIERTTGAGRHAQSLLISESA
jgi:Taurine catabolism dioxygenase TauD, TfdA family